METALRNTIEDLLSATLLYAFANDCHKRNENQKRKQRKIEAPFPPLLLSIGVRRGVPLGKDGRDPCKDGNGSSRIPPSTSLANFYNHLPRAHPCRLQPLRSYRCDLWLWRLFRGATVQLDML